MLLVKIQINIVAIVYEGPQYYWESLNHCKGLHLCCRGTQSLRGNAVILCSYDCDGMQVYIVGLQWAHYASYFERGSALKAPAKGSEWWGLSHISWQQIQLGYGFAGKQLLCCLDRT